MRIQTLFTGRLSKQAAFTRIASPFTVAMAAVVFLGVASQSAYAHFPIITAKIACQNNPKKPPLITYTVTSWDPGSHQIDGSGPHDGENPDVQVLFNGVVVDQGAFIDPADSFTNTMPAPGGTNTVTLLALAVGTWGDGFGGNEYSDPFIVNVPATCATGDVRFTGGGQQPLPVIVNGPAGPVELAKGFEVECDMNPQHENLELNWLGNHFHMDQITAAHCSLQGNLPNPPTAPENRIDGAGLGSYNNAEGYTVVFTLWDQGEPGAGVDESAFVVCLTDPANPNQCAIPANIVLNVPLNFISKGNIQAHVDQN